MASASSPSLASSTFHPPAWSNSFTEQAASLVIRDGESLLGGWIKVGTDDWITVYVPHVDMGQGVHTALAMMAAEELDADFSRVRAERAPAEDAFANRFLAEGWVLQNRHVPAFLDGTVDIAFAEVARFADLQITGGSTAVRFTGQVGMRTVGAAARAMLIEAAARRWGGWSWRRSTPIWAATSAPRRGCW